jgi:CheY-like chemotaxis protein
MITKPIKQSALLDAVVTAFHQDDFGIEKTQRVIPAILPEIGCSDDVVILVAEDNAVNRRLALLQLKKMGYRAETVENGSQAVTAVATGRYALVLMDCHMPELDGYSATGAIREAEAHSGKHIPIIAMTANAMPEDRTLCLAAGMDDYITKPVKADALQGIIEQWLPTSSMVGTSVE